ncbi:MAG: Nitrogen permease regulator 2 [Alyxoria varia]|nr:MAG: Nitrogen permease regulator 2 [Alyxoria varia]
MKLFPSSPPQVTVKQWHVPLSAAQLLSIDSDALDMTMQRIVPHIDGVSSVAKIAKRVDAHIDLACQAISHLFKQGYVLLTDIFQFSSVYVPTPQIRSLLFDDKMRDDCAKLVSLKSIRMDPDLVVKLYTSMTYGQTLKNWCIDNWDSLTGIDIRRFVTVGVLRGLLHRVHKYPFSPQHGNPTKERPPTLGAIHEEDEKFPRLTVNSSSERDSAKQDATSLDSDAVLDRYLDGSHCFDEICTTFGAHEKVVLARMRASRDVHVIQK